MENHELEHKKNELNLEIRSLLAIIDMVDGQDKPYPNYEEGTLDEVKFLEIQIELVKDARTRLLDVFKD